jgi:hypothetical protein
VQQRPRESLRSFIQRFSQVRNIIPHVTPQNFKIWDVIEIR